MDVFIFYIYDFERRRKSTECFPFWCEVECSVRSDFAVSNICRPGPGIVESSCKERNEY